VGASADGARQSHSANNESQTWEATEDLLPREWPPPIDPPTFARIKAMQAAGYNSRQVADAMQLALALVNKVWLLLDSRVVELSMASNPTFVILSSLKPLFFNSLQNELHLSDNMGASDPRNPIRA